MMKNRLVFSIRWFARLTGLAFLGLFLWFFINEGINDAASITLTQIGLFLFVPVLFTIGLFLAFKRELLGGILIILSVIGANLVDMISSGEFPSQVEFAFLLIPGILFALLPYLANLSIKRGIGFHGKMKRLKIKG
jgi:ABC-type polysaccharide/polyol phosphate export permease